MTTARVFLVLLVGVLLIPAAALAHQRATRAERVAILAAVVRQGELSRAQANCQVVTISTVNHNYAAVTWPSRLSHSCLRVAANGVIVEHRTSRGWKFVTVGSSFQCPVRALPTPVARDLGICS